MKQLQKMNYLNKQAQNCAAIHISRVKIHLFSSLHLKQLSQLKTKQAIKMKYVRLYVSVFPSEISKLKAV